MKWLKLALQNLDRNRRRTIATLLLIAIGMTGIMTTTGFALYTYESLQEFSMRENGQLIISHANYFTHDEEYPLEYGLDYSQTIRQSLLKDMDITYVLASIDFNGLITNGDKSTIFVGRGVDTDLPKVMGPALNITQGRFLSRNPDDALDFEIILGKKLAGSLGAEIGTGLTLMAATADGALNAIDVIVHGIVETGIPEMDARYVMVHNESAQFLLDTQRVSQLGVYLSDNQQQAVYSDQFASDYPTLLTTPWQDRAFFYTSVKNLYDRIFGMMGVVMLIMVMFAIFNTSAMSVMERLREIGTLSAMGTRRQEVIRLFAYEAALLSVIGSFLGCLFSGAITLFLMVFEVKMPAPPGQTEGYPLQVYFSPEVFTYALAGIGALAIIASLMAVRKGINLSISEALRYA